MNLSSINDPKGLLKFLFRPRHLVAIALGSGLVLLLPSTFMGRLGLVAFRGATRSWFGVALLFSVTLLLTQGVSALHGWYSQLRRRREMRRRHIENLSGLTEEERKLLRGYIEHDRKTRTLAVNSGVVIGLTHKDVLYRASRFAHKTPWGNPTKWYGPVNMNDWAWSYLHEHPELIDSNE